MVPDLIDLMAAAVLPVDGPRDGLLTEETETGGVEGEQRAALLHCTGAEQRLKPGPDVEDNKGANRQRRED